MPGLSETDEAERRQTSENELFDDAEESEEMAKKQERKETRAAPILNKDRASVRKANKERDAREQAKVQADKLERRAEQANSRAVRAALRAGAMEGVEAAPQRPVEPAPQAREATVRPNAAEEARRVEAALQEQIARDNAGQNHTSTAHGSEMDIDAAIATQLEAEMAGANVGADASQANAADEARRMDAALQEQIVSDNTARDDRRASTTTSSEMDHDADIAAQFEAEMADAAVRANALQAPASADNLRLQQLEAENRALRKAAEMANQERLDAVSERMAETARADDATAAGQQLAKQLSQSNFDRNFAVKQTGELESQIEELTARQSALEQQSGSAIAMGNASTDMANRALQEADARANQLENANEVLRRARDEAVNSLAERDQQLAQAEARNGELMTSKQAADLQIEALERRNIEQVEMGTRADLRADAEEANREAAERELDKRNGELRSSKESLAAEKTARQQADAKITELGSQLNAANEAVAREKEGRQAAERDLSTRDRELKESRESLAAERNAHQQADAKITELGGQLNAANETAVREKQGREALEKEVTTQKQLVSELSGKGDKAEIFETARREAEAKASTLESQLQSATKLAERERTGREAAEKNAQELTIRNEQLATLVTQARDQAEGTMKVMSTSESELRQQLAQERVAREIAETKLTSATNRMVEQSKVAATARRDGTQQATRDAERIAGLEAELKAARETRDPDKPIPSIENDETRKDASRAATAAKEDEFGLDDFDDADFDAALAAAGAKQAAIVKGPGKDASRAAMTAKEDEFGLDNITAEQFDAALAAAGAKQAATVTKATGASRTTSASPSREGSPALDPAHSVKGNALYRAGKMYVPEALYDKMLKADRKFDKEVKQGQIEKVPLEADKSAREVILQTPKGDLHSPKVYKRVFGTANFEARAKAEGLDPEIGTRRPDKDQTRPETLVKMKNGNFVDGKNLLVAADKAGLASKFGEKNVFIENEIAATQKGTGNYRRLDNAIEHARLNNGLVRLNQRLETLGVSPQRESRDSRSATPVSQFTKSSSAPPTKQATKAERAASPNGDRTLIRRNGNVVASVPANGDKGGVKRLNNNQRAASAPPHQNARAENRNGRSGGYIPATSYQQPGQGGAHNRQTSPTTTINLTVNGAVGHGTATPNVAANAAPQTKYTTQLDTRTRNIDPHGVN
jgi:hypothetical protein